jgi:hypothetical protein
MWPFACLPAHLAVLEDTIPVEAPDAVAGQQGSQEVPEFSPLGNRRLAAFQGKNQIFCMKFQFLQPHFFELFVLGEVGFSKQFFQPLSVAMMFGMQAIDLFAQRGIL